MVDEAEEEEEEQRGDEAPGLLLVGEADMGLVLTGESAKESRPESVTDEDECDDSL